MQESDRRDVHLAIGVQNEPAFQFRNQLRYIDEAFDLIELQNGCHGNTSRWPFALL
jgi:hypothetical protein